MLTEYDVLNAINECNGATCNEISPSMEVSDRRETYKLLEILEAAQLIQPVFRRGDDFAYSLTPAGQYRLQQLKEQIGFQSKAVLEAEKQRRTGRIQFWITFAVTLVGTLAAVGSLIATIVLH